jgi:hypothetical protein
MPPTTSPLDSRFHGNDTGGDRNDIARSSSMTLPMVRDDMRGGRADDMVDWPSDMPPLDSRFHGNDIGGSAE